MDFKKEISMGQQYIRSIGMYSKPVKKEFPSEYSCLCPDEVSQELLDMVFYKQYGIFFYEPCSREEAIMMINKFEACIDELKKEYEVEE